MQEYEYDPNPFTYCGEYFDKNSGTYFLRARRYDPSIGRFTTVDPAKDGTNLYVYCRSNPVNFFDRNGMQAEWIQNLIATSNLIKILEKQYSILEFRNLPIFSEIINNRINNSFTAVVSNKDTINAVANRFGVPNEIIAAIILKEQITQSIPDEIANLHTLSNSNTPLHSTGLGAIFATTAREAFNRVLPERVLPDSNAELQLLLSTNETFNIEAIAVVLVSYAIELGIIEDASQAGDMSVDDWKTVVARYNGTGQKAKDYADKVYEYLLDIQELLD